MLVRNLPVDNLLLADLKDPVYRVLNLMQDNRVAHIAVQDGEKFAGVVNEAVLMDVDDDLTLGELKHLFLNLSVNQESHLLNAVALAADNDLTVVPVTDQEGNLKGALEAFQLLKYLAEFMHLREPGALIVLEMDIQQYSFSEISKILETNDAQITQLNTSRMPDSSTMLVTIRTNKIEISDIIATFQRYEYNVKYYSGVELYANELKTNYENLMNYLNI